MYTSKRAWCSAFGPGSPHRMVSVLCGALSAPSWPVRELKPSAQDHTAPECPRHVCTHTHAHRRERCAQCSENMRVHKAWPLMGSSPHCLPLSSPSPPSSFWGNRSMSAQESSRACTSHRGFPEVRRAATRNDAAAGQALRRSSTPASLSLSQHVGEKQDGKQRN